MQIIQIMVDRSLNPRSLPYVERNCRSAFIFFRLMEMVTKDPFLLDLPLLAIKDSEMPLVRSTLTAEIGKANVAFSTIRSRISSDTLHLSLSSVDKRVRNSYLKLLKVTLEAMRDRIVMSIVWRTLGQDPSLLDPAKIDKLHYLVDRRLRLAERMMYDVGAGGPREWQMKEIKENPSGPWKDGWNRMFEYPRVPQKKFKSLCNPAPTGDQFCRTAGMTEWRKHGKVHISFQEEFSRIRVNKDVRNMWEPPIPRDPERYILFFKRSTTPNIDPVDALKMLFTPHEDFMKRNLFFCDHVIHSLHLESLVFAKEKRGAPPGWLRALVDEPTRPDGWLRIDASMRVFDQNKKSVFLANENGGSWFEHKTISERELIVGDHVVVWNHPAYDQARVGGVWRLENGIVVQTDPETRIQGHGTIPLTKEKMVDKVREIFDGALKNLQTIAKNSTPPPPTKVINFGGNGTLFFRDTPAPFTFDSDHQYANWWLVWRVDNPDEEAVANDEELRQEAHKRQKIVYIHNANEDKWYGAFPLWDPARKSKRSPQFVTNPQGEISMVKEVRATPEMFAVWSMWFPKGGDTSKLRVIRPKD